MALSVAFLRGKNATFHAIRKKSNAQSCEATSEFFTEFDGFAELDLNRPWEFRFAKLQKRTAAVPRLTPSRVLALPMKELDLIHDSRWNPATDGHDADDDLDHDGGLLAIEDAEGESDNEADDNLQEEDPFACSTFFRCDLV